jgi:hypothetical protein
MKTEVGKCHFKSKLVIDLNAYSKLAERVGFEPTSRETPELDFESSAFDHSATFPGGGGYYTAEPWKYEEFIFVLCA